jgi:hypothetical protein
MGELSGIANLVSDYISSKYPEKIAIIVIYGSIYLGTESKHSDLDMFAITDEDTQEYDISFIYKNHPVDLWSMSWKKAYRIARGDDPNSPWCVGASLFVHYEILYSRSQKDLERFLTLRKIVEQTQNTRKKNLERVLDHFDSLYSFEKIKLAKEKDDLLSARWAAWGLIINVTNKLSWLNNEFFTKNWGSNFQQVVNLSLKPKNLEELVNKLSCSDDYDELLSAGRELVANMRNLVRDQQKLMNVGSVELNKNDYIHMKEYFNKIYSACDKKDILAASYAATELQIWISEVIASFNGLSAFDFNLFQELREHYDNLQLLDLTSLISKKDYTGLYTAVKELEDRIFNFYTGNGQIIPIFNDSKTLREKIQNNNTIMRVINS